MYYVDKIKLDITIFIKEVSNQKLLTSLFTMVFRELEMLCFIVYSFSVRICCSSSIFTVFIVFFSATDISPLSSETTMAIASVFSAIPRAARCLKP